MKADVRKILELFDGKHRKLFIPVYQRNYDWQRENCEQLFRDLRKLIESDKKSHFFGSIVTTRLYGDGDSLVIIDGQQRITTVFLLLLAMINAIKADDAHADSPSICAEMTFCIGEDDYSDSIKIRLKSASGDNDAFLKIVAYRTSDS